MLSACSPIASLEPLIALRIINRGASHSIFTSLTKSAGLSGAPGMSQKLPMHCRAAPKGLHRSRPKAVSDILHVAFQCHLCPQHSKDISQFPTSLRFPDRPLRNQIDIHIAPIQHSGRLRSARARQELQDPRKGAFNQ